MSYSGEILTFGIFILNGSLSYHQVEEYKNNILPLAIQKYKDKFDKEWEKAVEDYLIIPKSNTYGYFVASFACEDMYVGEVFDIVYKYNDEKMQ